MTNEQLEIQRLKSELGQAKKKIQGLERHVYTLRRDLRDIGDIQYAQTEELKDKEIERLRKILLMCRDAFSKIDNWRSADLIALIEANLGINPYAEEVVGKAVDAVSDILARDGYIIEEEYE